MLKPRSTFPMSRRSELSSLVHSTDIRLTSKRQLRLRNFTWTSGSLKKIMFRLKQQNMMVLSRIVGAFLASLVVASAQNSDPPSPLRKEWNYTTYSGSNCTIETPPHQTKTTYFGGVCVVEEGSITYNNVSNAYKSYIQYDRYCGSGIAYYKADTHYYTDEHCMYLPVAISSDPLNSISMLNECVHDDDTDSYYIVSGCTSVIVD